MNDFKNLSPENLEVQKLDLEISNCLKNNKFSEAAELCYEMLKKIDSLPQSDKEGEKELLDGLSFDVRDRLTLCKLKIEDYDSAIEECLKALERRENYTLHSRVGICYFKKGKYYKARDHFNKAVTLNPNENDKIVDNYIKQTAEMIADIES